MRNKIFEIVGYNAIIMILCFILTCIVQGMPKALSLSSKNLITTDTSGLNSAVNNSSISPASPKKPNVIIILADDMGYGDLHNYGGKYLTLNIDKTGQEGIRSTSFYVEPVCTPSRYSMLTGSYSIRSMHGLTHPLMPNAKNYLDTSETTLADYLKSAGYQVALIRKWHLEQYDQQKTLSHLP